MILRTIVCCIFDAAVHVVSAFVAAVLSHPSVKTAGSAIIVDAMNEFLRQPDLDEHVKIMSETMSRNQKDAARSAGEEFPKLVGHFLQGMILPRREKISSTAASTSSGSASSTETRDSDPLGMTVTTEEKENGVFEGLRNRFHNKFP